MKIFIRCWERSRVYIVTVCGQKARRVDGDRTWVTKLRDRISPRLLAQGIPALKASSLSGRTLQPLPILRLVFFRETVELLGYYLSNTTGLDKISILAGKPRKAFRVMCIGLSSLILFIH